MVGREDGRAERPVGIGFCACGCGRPTRIATRTQVGLGHVKGQPVRFRPGHATRGRKFALERLRRIGGSGERATAQFGGGSPSSRGADREWTFGGDLLL